MTGPRVFAAPTVDADSPWMEVGHLAELPAGLLTFEPEDADDLPSFSTSLLALLPAPGDVFESHAVAVDALALFSGRHNQGDTRPRYSVEAEYVDHVPDGIPATPPVKRRRLTGKAYRAARRAYARRHRAWVRAGAPTVALSRRVVIPSVAVTGIERIQGAPDTYSIACEVAAR